MNLSMPELTAIGAAFTASITAIIKNTEITESVVRFLVKRLNKVELIDFKDLKQHDYIIKLEQIANASYYDTPIELASKQKEMLFFKYVNIVGSVSLTTSKLYLDNAHLKLDEQALKSFVLTTLTNQYNEYDKQFTSLLLEYGNDKEAIAVIVQKVGIWRLIETKLLLNNVNSVISSGKISSIPYKFDTLFSLYSLGLDMLLVNGAESFNKLNGELDTFLTPQS